MVTNAFGFMTCDDGIDNDGDGRVDFGAGPTRDPGCWSPLSHTEAPACDDANTLVPFVPFPDNDGDGLTDFPAGPECKTAWDSSEKKPGAQCGMGFELILLLPPLMWLRRRRGRRTP